MSKGTTERHRKRQQQRIARLRSLLLIVGPHLSIVEMAARLHLRSPIEGGAMIEIEFTERDMRNLVDLGFLKREAGTHFPEWRLTKEGLADRRQLIALIEDHQTQAEGGAA